MQPPTPTWGWMLSDGRNYVATAWWLATFPGLAIMPTVLAVNLLGDRTRPPRVQSPPIDMPSLLSVEGLETHFATEHGVLRAVNGITFAIDRGATRWQRVAVPCLPSRSASPATS